MGVGGDRRVVKRQWFVVTEAEAGVRLDRVVAKRLPALSRGAVRALFSEGRVLRGSTPVAKGALAETGMQLTIEGPARPASHWPLRIVLETSTFVIVDKPAGQPSVSLPGRPAPSVAAALLERHPETRGVGYGEHDAGLLSRLDTDTSGLLLCAKTRLAFTELRAGAAAGRLIKGYLGLVHSPDGLRPGSIELPLGPSRSSRRKVATGSAIRGKAVDARTEVVAVETRGELGLVHARVFTAYRHQVRAHLALSGYPLLGDALYGGRPVPGLERHALHAHRLTWLGSEGVNSFDVELPLARDLARLWES